MRILITGGNGYVGRTLTRLLYGEHSVAVLDCIRQDKIRFEPDELGQFTLFRDDIRDFPAVDAVIRSYDPQVVIHLAAIHFIPECESRPDEAISINTLGTVNLLRALRPGTRFVFASTAAVYAPESTPHNEVSSPTGPMDVYGLTKLQAEDYIRYWSTVKPIDARIVRLFNVVGPGETNPHLLPAILAQVLGGTRTLRLGNCAPKRDYVHVDDVARGFAAVALGDRVVDGVDVVNLGGGAGYSVTEVVEQLSGVIGEPLTIEVDPARVRASDRPFLSAEIGRIRKHYGWSPQKTMEDSLRDLWANPDVPAELLKRS